MSTKLARYHLDELQQHPWQVNIPDITGKEWAEFLADIRERGVQDPITVSMRTGVPVIVDGHQRVRAARECGYELLEALEKPFVDEGEEIITLANSALLRRQLTDGQKYVIYERLKKEFAKEAAQNVGGRPSKEVNRVEGEQAIFEEEKPTSNLKEVSRQQRESTTRAAKAVGFSVGQAHKAEKVYTTAPAPVRDAWMQGEVSTHAAHTLTTKSPEPVRQALNEGKINVQQARAIQKHDHIVKQVNEATITVDEGVKMSDVMQKEIDTFNQQTGFEVADRVDTAYEKILQLGYEGIIEGHNSPFNRQVQQDPLWEKMSEVLDVLLRVKKTLEGEDKDITVDVMRIN